MFRAYHYKRQKVYYVYILMNRRRTVLYIGMTGDMDGRLYDHKQKKLRGFTQKYNVDELVYYEAYFEAHEAISREKQLKKWSRQKKLDLIASANPEYRELSGDNEWLGMG